MDINEIKIKYTEGDFENCCLLCERGLINNSDDYDLLSYYAACLMKRGLYEKSIDIFTKLIDRKPGFHLYRFRGDSYYELEKYDLAADDYKKSIELDPDNGALWDCAARALYKAGKLKEAYKHIDKAIEISEGAYDPLTIKALFLRLEGKTNDSFKLFSEIRKKYPEKDFLRDEQLRIIEDSLVNINKKYV